MNLIFHLAQAAGDAPAGAQPSAPGLGGLLMPVLLMLGVFYFLLIRPQKKQEKARKEMLKDLQKNDKVVTIGGLHGVVASIRKEDETITLKVGESENVRLKVARSAISRILSAEDEKEE